MKNSTLNEAANEFLELLESIDPDTGEIGSDQQQFCKVKDALTKKASSVAAWIIDNEAHAAMVEEHAKKLLDRAKSARKRANWVREYLQNHMKITGITSIKSEDGTFSVKLELDRDESVDVFDDNELPKIFYHYESIKKIDRIGIRNAIKNGDEVIGARLVRKDRLTIK
jgi:hypothetical protein